MAPSVGIRPCIAASTGATSTNAPLASRMRATALGAPGGDLGRGRDALVRQGLPCRQQRDPLGAEERLEVGGERLGLTGAGRHGEQGRLERGRHARDHEVLAGLGPGHDRTRTLEQEPLERLGTHEHLERVSQSQPRTSRTATGHQEQASPRAGGALGEAV